MASLINRIQRAMLGSAGEEKVRALLAELRIPAGGSGTGTMRQVRRGFLRPISDEAILRDALANLGLNGGGTGERPISNIRAAILHNLRDSKTTLCDGLNDMLAPEDLAPASGNGAPDWVPANAKIHIDFLGGAPQGRAWTSADGEVAIETLLGHDSNADNYSSTEYSSENLIEGEGLDQVSATAFTGPALDKILAGATVRQVTKRNSVVKTTAVVFLATSEDSENMIEVDIRNTIPTVVVQSTNTGATGTGVVNTSGAMNVIAYTVIGSRLEAAVNGAAVVALTLDPADNPPGNPRLAALFKMSNFHSYIQSITLYDPLPSTAGLPGLSVP